MQGEDLTELFAGLPNEELAVREENLDRYLDLAWEILQELKKEKLPD
jgi:hypothetical protein